MTVSHNPLLFVGLILPLWILTHSHQKYTRDFIYMYAR